MKNINLIFCFLIMTTTAKCSITRERNWTWSIVCNPETLTLQVHASAVHTSFDMQKGTLFDHTHDHGNLLILIVYGIAQNIHEHKISQKRTAFLIPTSQDRYHALVYDPTTPDSINYFDIQESNQYLKFDSETFQELKKLTQSHKNLQK